MGTQCNQESSRYSRSNSRSEKLTAGAYTHSPSQCRLYTSIPCILQRKSVQGGVVLREEDNGTCTHATRERTLALPYLAIVRVNPVIPKFP